MTITNKFIGVTILCALIACSGSAPQRAPDPDPDPRPATRPDPLVGTMWMFCDQIDSMITFQSEGRVRWSAECGAGHPCDCGAARWARHGDRIAFDCNQVTEYDVTAGAREMLGDWHRIASPSEHAPVCLERIGASSDLRAEDLDRVRTN